MFRALAAFVLLFSSTAVLAPAAAAAATSLTLQDIDGQAILVASDGAYLGVLSSNQYDSQSVCNPYGDFGSKYSDKSVRDECGPYGSPYSDKSAYDVYSPSPPMIFYNREAVGYLSKNAFLAGSVDPDLLFAAFGCVRA